MSGVFQNIYPPPPPPLVRGEDTHAGWRGGGGSIFWKTPDTALYSTYVSTLWSILLGSFRNFTKMRNLDFIATVIDTSDTTPGKPVT
jgi:hypothetical protein